MNAVRQRIWDTYKAHAYTDFHLHNDLIGVCACSENFIFEEETADFEEIVFAVEIDWLLTYKNKTSPEYWSKNRLHKWLKSEYTSDDAAAIFKAAIAERKVAILEFN